MRTAHADAVPVLTNCRMFRYRRSNTRGMSDGIHCNQVEHGRVYSELPQRSSFAMLQSLQIFTWFGTGGVVPKIIWMLWLQGWENAPSIAHISLDSWARRNPGWRLEALTLDSLPKFLHVSMIEEFTRSPKPPEALANLIRIELLYQHGGVWADATTICAVPLDQWLAEAMPNDFFAFSKPGPDRMLSNWFLAASKGSQIISDWRREGREYWNGRTERDAYFWHHRCFSSAYEKSAAFRALWDESPKLAAANRFHFGPNSLELLAPPEPDIEALLAAPPVPVFKLTHKFASVPGRDSLFSRLARFAVDGG